uniref:Zinc finger protein 706 n=1 Tax=Hucho hucho TaxID=62062 RepID=A0A4W5JKY7_9TELE
MAAAAKKNGVATNQKTAAKAALVHIYPVCRTDLKTFKQHFDSKHPKSSMVPMQA